MLWAIIIAFFMGGTLGMVLICLLSASREFDGAGESQEELILK